MITLQQQIEAQEQAVRTIDPRRLGMAESILTSLQRLQAAEGQDSVTNKTEAEKSRGYVALGSGAYRLQQCENASLVICFRRPDEIGLPVGHRADEIDLTPIQSEDIIVMLKFVSAEGLDSLETHLREIRLDNFPDTVIAKHGEPAIPETMLAAAKGGA